MNGVCVRWRGWVDLERLDGVGCLEYDEETAQVRNDGKPFHYCFQIFKIKKGVFDSRTLMYNFGHKTILFFAGRIVSQR